MPTQYYRVWGELLGSRPAPLIEVTRGGPQWPMSHAFICPGCGELWARIMCDARGSGAPWTPISTSCNLCGSGSLLLPWLPICGDVPLPVLQWEFNCALNAYEKELENAQT